MFAMKTRHVLFTLFLWGLLAASPAWAVRDPFWPIGYSPVSAKEPEAAQNPAAKKPEPPKEKPITDTDWSKARQALPINGITKSIRPDTHETRVLAMINRQTFALGDTVSFVHKDIRFQWRVESIADGDVKLEPLQAERIPQKSSDLKQPTQTNSANSN